jgi:hypothetical protein
LNFSTKGYSQSDIARILQVDMSVICRDVIFLKQQSRDNIRKYIDEKLSEEYEKCVVGLNTITKESYDAAHNTEDKKDTSFSTCKRMLFNEVGFTN